jgi:hypothetical protein
MVVLAITIVGVNNFDLRRDCRRDTKPVFFITKMNLYVYFLWLKIIVNIFGATTSVSASAPNAPNAPTRKKGSILILMSAAHR